MKLRHSLGASALTFVVTACGLGDGADIGDSTKNLPIGSMGGSMNEGSGGAESGEAAAIDVRSLRPRDVSEREQPR